MSPRQSTKPAAQDDEFAAPDEVTGIEWAALKGHLLVIEPTKLEQDVKTAFGDTDAVRANVHDVSAKESHTDILIFPKVLVGSLKGKVGSKVLAKLGQGTAKPGQDAPWVLEDMSANDRAKAAARAYLATVAKPAPKAESAPAPAVETWDDDDEPAGDVPF